MEEQDYEEEYRRDVAFLEAEKLRMEAEWREMEEYEEQLPARIITKIEINKKESITKN